MTTNKLMMWNATFSHPSELSDTMLGMPVTMLPDIAMMVMAAPAIDSEVAEGVAYAVEVLVEVIIGVAPVIVVVDILTANAVAALMAPLEPALSS